MKKILLVFGTRPEAIKMAPLVSTFKRYTSAFDVRVCITAQHRAMLDQVLDFFDIIADYDLNLMKPNQNLYQLTSEVILGMKGVLDEFEPNFVLVHGDTTTSMAAAMAAYYSGVKVAHVEAGLRTYNKYSPFPEEMNRQVTGRIADIHFAPTVTAKDNLLSEGINEETITVVGNTIIDALFLAKNKLLTYENDEIIALKQLIKKEKKIILVTGHRRENFGAGFLNICKALEELSKREDIQIIYPVHLNPNVQKPVFEILGGINSISLIEPLTYPSFVWLMSNCYLILTDSGGIQEEAPSLNKPVLVMRDNTERPEAIMSGAVKLVGTKKKNIIDEVSILMDDQNKYSAMMNKINPYGDGSTSLKIANVLTNVF